MAGLAGYSYRLSASVANPTTQGNRQLTLEVPAWFLRAQGKIARSDYNDVRVTTADGTTTLPCTLNAAKNAVTVDYASMPVGRTTLYFYYSNASATAPTAAAYGEAGVTPLDAGFENGTNGSTLSTPWTVGGTGGTATYSNSSPAKGSMCGAVASTTNAYKLLSETTTAGMTANTAEIRFWLKAGQTTQSFYIYDNTGSLATRTHLLLFNGSGQIQTYTERSVTGYTQNGYTTVGTYSTSWVQYRITFNFTTKRFTLSSRASSSDGWTQLKASGASDYNIPFCGANNITQTNGWAAQVGTGSAATVSISVDSLLYANGGITDPSLVAQVFPFNAEETDGSTARRYYLWGDDLEATYLNSAATTTYYGTGTNHLLGVTSASTKYHYLLRYFEGGLPLGTVSEAKLHLYAESLAVAQNTELRCHRFKSTTADAGTYAYRDTVKCGWVNQPVGYPTWATRMNDYQFVTTSAWQTAGATHANEIDSAEYVSANLTSGDAAGYKTFTLTNSWVSDWASHSKFSNGVLIKDSTDSATANRYITVTAPSQTNSPVFEVAYSALDADQFSKRKLTANIYCYGVFSSHNRFIANPDTNQFAVAAWVDGAQKMSVAMVEPGGRTHLCAKSTFSSGEVVSANGAYGIYYDDSTGRYWLLAGNATSAARCGVSNAYDPTTWTWASGSATLYKGDFVVRNDTAHIVTMDGSYRLGYYTWARGGAMSSETVLHNAAFSGTQRTLSTQILNTDVMTGSGTIYTSGALTDYPSFGALYIDTELFWYTGISGNNFTGVTRACYGSTAATHAVSTTVNCDHQALTYAAIADDATSMHVLYTVQSNSGASTPVNLSSSRYSYNWTNYIRHDFADAAGTWHDESGTTLTLPLTQSTARRLDSGAKLPTYLSASIVHGGSVYVALQELKKPSGSATTSSSEFLNNTDLDFKVAKLTSGTWTYSDPQDMTAVCFVSTAQGLAAPGLTIGTPLQKKYSLNTVGSWGTVATLADYTGLPDAKGTYLWSNGSAGESNFDSKVLSYCQHQAYFGAIFLDATTFPVVITAAGPMFLFHDYDGGFN